MRRIPRPSRDEHSKPSEAESIEAARRRIERDFRLLKGDLKTLAGLLNQAEKTPWSNPIRERVIGEIGGLVIQCSAGIFRTLGEVHLAVAAHKAGGAKPSSNETPAPPLRKTRTFQNLDSDSPAARVRTACRQIEWDYWLLKENLKTLVKLVRQAKAHGGTAFHIERDIDQLGDVTVQRSAEIFRAIGEIHLAVAAHQVDRSEADGSRVLPEG